MLDKNFLRRCRAALHTVEDDDIGPGFDRKRDIEIWTACADLQIDRLFPIRYFAKLVDFNFEIIGTLPRPQPIQAYLIILLQLRMGQA